MKCEKINLRYPPNCVKYTISAKAKDGELCVYYKIFSSNLLVNGRNLVAQELKYMRSNIRDKIKVYNETGVR